MKFTLVIIFYTFAVTSLAQFGEAREISNSNADPEDVQTADIDGDGDGDKDIVSCSWADDKVVWYENLGSGNFGPMQLISKKADGANSIYTADLDNDGDIDIISTSQYDNKLAWYENTGNGAFISQQIISTNLDYPYSCFAEDLDNDGDMDVLSASLDDGKIAWYENLGSGNFGPQNVITTSGSCRQVLATDMDNDGDMDVLYAAGFNRLAWFENLGGAVFGVEQDMQGTNTSTTNPSFIYAADINNNGFKDVLTGSWSGGGLDYYRNVSGTIVQQPMLVSTTLINKITDGVAADLDNDGDLDVVYVSGNQTALAWNENIGNGIFGPQQIILSLTNDGYQSMIVDDIDNDGLQDIITTSYIAKVSWHKNLGGGTFGPQQSISAIGDSPSSIVAFDLDNDGDLDVLSCSGSYDNVFWHENLGGGSFGDQTIISNETDGTKSVYAADLDNDGDVDVISASYTDDKIAWYENLGNGIFGTQQILTTNADNAQFVFSADLDNDGDMDVLSASYNDDKIAWYENTGSGVFSSQQIITTSADGATSLHCADLDNDGDMDVISSSKLDDKIAWYENTGGGTFGAQQIISINANEAASVFSSDIDNDGDMDVIYTAPGDNLLAWHENLSGGVFGVQQVISSTSIWSYSIYIADVNNDGFQDVLTCSDNKEVWHENLGGGLFGAQHSASEVNLNISSVYAADLDNDGSIDIMSAARGEAKLAWFKNYTLSNYQLKGKSFFDANQDGIINNGELGLHFIPTQIQPQSKTSFTSSNGSYFHAVDTGSYDISYTPNALWNLTSDSLTYTRSVSISTPIHDSLNFGFFPNSVVSIVEPDLIGGFPRCNDTVNYWLNIRNIGTTIPSGIIEVKLDNAISYVSSNVVPDSINGQNLFWHYDSLFYFSEESINLKVKMPPFTSIGDTLKSILSVNEMDGSNNVIYSNNDTLNQVLVCAYDPNDKTVSPKGIGNEGYILANQELEYLIRFQNTGNDTAINVMVRDHLDNNLDWNTFTPIASSHPNMQVSIEQDGEVVFKFDSIMLPDSNVNELASQGFIKYKIKMIPNLEPGINIYNTGHIYFDANPAVITNTVLNTIYDCNTAPISLMSTNICFGEELEAIVLEGDYSEYKWEIDTFYTSIVDDLNWTSDTIGSFSLKLTISNALCSKDTTVGFTVLPSIPVTNNSLYICQGDSTLLAGEYQKTDGIYQDTLQSSIGCDSIISTDLIVYPIFSYYEDVEICQGDSALIFGSYQNNNGTYFDSLQTNLGCDSVYIVNLIVNGTFSSNFTTSICQGDSIFLANSYQDSAGVYLDSLQSINGCDSIVSTTIVVNPVYSINQGISICQGDSSLIHGNYENSVGIFYDTLQSINGCDSVIAVSLSINPTFVTNQNILICQGDSSLIHGSFENNAGIFYDTLQSLNGCDSVIAVSLAFNPTFITNQSISICQGDSVFISGIYQNTSGVYYDTLQSINSCDSVIATSLIINPTFVTNQSISICQGDSALLHGIYQNATGVYYDTLQSINSCDSVIATSLIINPTFVTNQNISICQGDSALLNGIYQNTTGVYYDTLQSVNSCDSVLAVSMTVYHTYLNNQNISICQGDSILIHGTFQHTNGTFYDTLLSINGCDSLLATTLTINPLPIVTIEPFIIDTICNMGNTLALPNGLPSGGNYVGNGVDVTVFNPVISGIGLHNVIYFYSDSNSCTNSDTTTIFVDLCTEITEQNNTFQIKVYPNPSSGIFNIVKLIEFDKAFKINIFDSNSKLIITEYFPSNEKELKIDLKQYSSGVYYLHLLHEHKTYVHKIIRN